MKKKEKRLTQLIAGMAVLVMLFSGCILEDIFNYMPGGSISGSDDCGYSVPSFENGLVGEWLFDGSANESVSGSAPLVNKAGYAAVGIKGVSNTAFAFYSVSTYPYTNGHYLAYASQMSNLGNYITIAAWVYPEAPDSRILGNHDNNSTAGFYLHFSSSNTFDFTVANSTYKEISSAVKPLTNWYFVTGVYNRTIRTMKIYVNGVLENTVTNHAFGQFIYSNTEWPDCRNFEIGRFWGGGLNNMKGSIDNVRLYNRVLSDHEIFGIYTNDLW